MRIHLTPVTLGLALAATLPMNMGAQGGCGGSSPIVSTTATPDIAGRWAITYEPTLEVDVRIGGAVQHKSLPAAGGTFSITQEGKPITFKIDCARPEVVCPSEVWPGEVAIEQREAMYPHRMWVKIPTQKCSGKEAPADPKKCGQGTPNPDCKPVCDGEVTTTTAEAFGVINEGGSAFDLLLGGGIASNGVNCVLLGLSTAKANLINIGAARSAAWQAREMKDGVVKTGYAGGCLWAGDPNHDGQVEALVLGASVEISTKFSGKRAP